MVGLHVIEYLLRVPWVWGFQRGFLWVWDGYMGIEIPSPRQPWILELPAYIWNSTRDYTTIRLWIYNKQTKPDLPVLEKMTICRPMLPQNKRWRFDRKSVLVNTGRSRSWEGGHGELSSARLKWGSRGLAPSGVQGQSPWSGSQGAKPQWSSKRFGNHVPNFSLKYFVCLKTFYHAHVASKM